MIIQVPARIVRRIDSSNVMPFSLSEVRDRIVALQDRVPLVSCSAVSPEDKAGGFWSWIVGMFEVLNLYNDSWS